MPSLTTRSPSCNAWKIAAPVRHMSARLAYPAASGPHAPCERHTWLFALEPRFSRLVCAGAPPLIYCTVYRTSFKSVVFVDVLWCLQWQYSLVLITLLHLEAHRDFLYVCEWMQHADACAANVFTGTFSPRRLAIGEVGAAFVLVHSDRVNVTFASESSRDVQSARFELHLFPFYRICYCYDLITDVLNDHMDRNSLLMYSYLRIADLQYT